MLAQSLRLSRAAVARTIRQPVMARTFIVPTAARKADAVQEIYLNALRNYKPKPESLADAEGQVKKWSPPAAPPLPDSADANLASELSAYEQQAVEVEGQESSADGQAVPAKVEDWFEEDAVFGTDEAEGGHKEHVDLPPA